MDIDKHFKQIISKTKIVKTPKHRLSTFGYSKINYFFLSEVAGFKDRTRMREGIVVAEQPQIVTTQSLKEKFEGFGNEASQFGEWLGSFYGDSFKGLQYKFRNEGKSAHIEYTPVKILAEEIRKRLTAHEDQQSTIIQGPDRTWKISILKFIIDECMASFSSNLKELDEHGFFDDPDQVFKQRKKEIEELFSRARLDRRIVPVLGQKLQRYGFFQDYEERFFRLVKK